MTSLAFAVIGDPVAHSLSPRMHAAALSHLGLPHRYCALQTTSDELAERVRSLRLGEFAGMNVTLPHKRAVLGLVDRVEPDAARVGAANTLYVEHACIVATNTDVPALSAELSALAKDAIFDLSRGSCVVIGSGGAARAAVCALASLGARKVRIKARSEASDLALELSASLAGTAVVAEPLRPSERDDDVIAVVQATSAGMRGMDSGEPVARSIDWARVPREALALDVVYAPERTAFVEAALRRGVRATSGLGMLARQGALALERWLGVPAPLDVMIGALRAEGSADV